MDPNTRDHSSDGLPKPDKVSLINRITPKYFHREKRERPEAPDHHGPDIPKATATTQRLHKGAGWFPTNKEEGQQLDIFNSLPPVLRTVTTNGTWSETKASQFTINYSQTSPRVPTPPVHEDEEMGDDDGSQAETPTSQQPKQFPTGKTISSLGRDLTQNSVYDPENSDLGLTQSSSRRQSQGQGRQELQPRSSSIDHEKSFSQRQLEHGREQTTTSAPSRGAVIKKPKRGEAPVKTAEDRIASEHETEHRTFSAVVLQGDFAAVPSIEYKRLIVQENEYESSIERMFKHLDGTYLREDPRSPIVQLFNHIETLFAAHTESANEADESKGRLDDLQRNQKKLQEEKTALEVEKLKLESESRRLDGNNAQLQQDLRVERETGMNWYHSYHAVKKNFDDADRIVKDQAVKLTESEAERKRQVGALELTIQDKQEEILRTENRVREESRKKIDDLEKDLAAERSNYQKLLLSNSNLDRPITDEVLKRRFQKLNQAISDITGVNLRIADPRAISCWERDPVQQQRIKTWLARAGQSGPQHMLKNLLWGIIVDGFFSLPLGFGVLGGAETPGHQALYQFYEAWYALQGASTPDERSQNRSDTARYMPDNEASRCRSGAFQSIKAIVLAKDKDDGGRVGGPRRPLKRWYDDNLQLREKEITDLLEAVTKNTVPQSLLAKVWDAVNHAAELALDMGAQTAEVSLYRPLSRSVTIGERFHHYQNGADAGAGMSVEVDLLISPGLQRIGDGRDDLNGVKIIVPASVYSVRR